MNRLNKKLSTIVHLCKTYGINVVGENHDEVFLNSDKPIKNIEKLIAKITGKTVNWQKNNDSDEHLFSDTEVALPTNALEKIISSLLDVAFDAGATKIRLEPGSKDSRWRVYNHSGWSTLQYLPTNVGKQICDYFAKKINLKDTYLPHHNTLNFNDRNLKCSFQPVWRGTVVQLDLVKDNHESVVEIPDFFSKPTFSNLVLINQRRHRHKHSLAQQIEELSRKHDVITIGDKIGLNELATDFPTKEEDLNKLISNKPELVIINHHDVVGAINLVKNLQANNIKSIVNLTSYSPWPLLNYLSNQKLNSDAVIVSLSGEKVCHHCKKQINAETKINSHNETGVKDWLNNDIWENQTCDNNHEDEDFYVVIESWNGDLKEADKKIADHIDQLILDGVLTWQNKDNLLQDKNSNYFNF